MKSSQKYLEISRSFFSSKGGRNYLVAIAIFAAVFLLSWLVTDSIIITTAISTIALALPIEMARLSRAKAIKVERDAWPVVIDHLISAINSGVSLTQAIRDLGERGPEELKREFAEIADELSAGGAFHEVLRSARKKFLTSAADQVLEVLIIARVTGSSDIGSILRTLGEFLREESAMRAEIEARHGWVRSSAGLAAIAPWALLLILASQPSTRNAFTSETGIYILGFGIFLTAVAYMWMNFVGRLPEVPRALA